MKDVRDTLIILGFYFFALYGLVRLLMDLLWL